MKNQNSATTKPRRYEAFTNPAMQRIAWDIMWASLGTEDKIS
jgi:hypothetical protein